MEEISASSRKIGDIIGVIDGIAFQTNILALNAADEAAREIKALIATNVERVDAGAALVQSAGATMGEIVASAQRVSDLIGEVTAATAKQNQGIADVNQSIHQLDQMRQQNAALVEEAAAAASGLASQASQLQHAVERFRLDASDVEEDAQEATTEPRQVSRAPVRKPTLRAVRPMKVPALEYGHGA